MGGCGAGMGAPSIGDIIGWLAGARSHRAGRSSMRVGTLISSHSQLRPAEPTDHSRAGLIADQVSPMGERSASSARGNRRDVTPVWPEPNMIGATMTWRRSRHTAAIKVIRVRAALDQDSAKSPFQRALKDCAGAISPPRAEFQQFQHPPAARA